MPKRKRCKERYCFYADQSKHSGCADYNDISECIIMDNRREFEQRIWGERNDPCNQV